MVASANRGPNGWKWKVVFIQIVWYWRKTWDTNKKCIHEYFKPFKGQFEPEQPLQNEQKSQYPEYLSFAFHD